MQLIGLRVGEREGLPDGAADGFLRDLIVGSKLADQNALFGAEFLQNFVFAFNC